jgi:hypothetical protein
MTMEARYAGAMEYVSTVMSGGGSKNCSNRERRIWQQWRQGAARVMEDESAVVRGGGSENYYNRKWRIGR